MGPWLILAAPLQDTVPPKVKPDNFSKDPTRSEDKETVSKAKWKAKAKAFCKKTGTSATPIQFKAALKKTMKAMPKSAPMKAIKAERRTVLPSADDVGRVRELDLENQIELRR